MFLVINLICLCSASAFELKRDFYNTYPYEQTLISKSQRNYDEFIPISLLPRAAKGNLNFPIDEMQNWSKVQRKSYEIILKNSFGDFGGTIVHLVYHLDYLTHQHLNPNPSPFRT